MYNSQEVLGAPVDQLSKFRTKVKTARTKGSRPCAAHAGILGIAETKTLILLIFMMVKVYPTLTPEHPLL